MKILVTGGAGFIASHVVDAYISDGHEVLIVDNLSTGRKENLNPKAKFEELDLNDAKLSDVVNAFQPQVINHHAAQIDVRKSVENPIFDAQTNILGLLNLMEAAKQAGSVKKVILASTGGAIYGEADEIPTTETYPAWPISPYGIAKLTSEHYLHFYDKVHNLPFVSLRYGNVYGPRQNPHGEAGVVAIFYQRLLSGKEFTINGDGAQTRDFVFVQDVARASLLATNKTIKGIFNIGTSTETSVNQLVEAMNKSLDSSKEIPHGPGKPGEQKRSCLSFQKAKLELGWEPQVSLHVGLAKTASFFKNAV